MTGLIHETFESLRTPEEVKVDAEVLARVKRGIEFLQREFGDGWVENIDLETLDISNTHCCVLGQLYPPVGNAGGYYTAAGLHPDLRLVNDGFAAVAKDYGPLQDAWVAEIVARRNGST